MAHAARIDTSRKNRGAQYCAEMPHQCNTLINNGGAVKLTTALWYTPSGRSINRVRQNGEAAIPVDSADSTKRPRYKTDAGRMVLGGGGITPDVIVQPPPIAATDSAFLRALGSKVPQFRDALTDYALSVKTSKAISSPDFVVTPAMRAELLKRLQMRGVTIDSATYNSAATLLDRAIGSEIARYVFGDATDYARRLRSDVVVNKSLELISGAASQKDLLRRVSRVER